MKMRSDFVTNSSSSSFIITNKTDEDLNGRELLLKFLEPILQAAEENIPNIPAISSMEIICDDAGDAFEQFVHNTWGATYSGVYGGDVDVATCQFDKSYH